ncbi:hypothetical protein LEC33_21320 [Salmonella enterica]|nr:hypothetical protein [Salmonella enterica]MDJ7048990.1 hypothetical protein [Salmonella enterica]MDJ7338058.1 hypothetical protein [Salmonella enterica]
MKLLISIFIFLLFTFLASRINGFLAYAGWCLAGFIMYLSLKENYSFLYFFAILISSVLSFYSLSMSVSGFTSADEMKIYQTGIDRGFAFKVPECSGFQRVDTGDIRLAKESQFNNCSLQGPKGIFHQLIDFVTSYMSGVFSEVAVVAPLYPHEKLENKCLHSINRLIQLCPEEAVFYDKRILAEMNKKDLSQ